MFRSIGWQELIIVLVVASVYVVGVWLIWRIVGRTGMNPALSLLVLLPYVGPAILVMMLAFANWPALQNAPGNMPPAPGRVPAAPLPPQAPAVHKADWLADPTGEHRLRYWDGTNWTDKVAD